MKRAGVRGCFWPTDEQDLLLRLVLGPEADAPGVWRRLRPLDVEAVEAGTFPLLPLAAQRLERLDPEDPELDRLRGTYRKAWYRNQVHVRRLPEVLGRWEGAVLLGGIAIAAAYYPSLGTRPVFATDLLVETGPDAPGPGGLEFPIRERLPVPLYPGAEADFRFRAGILRIGETEAAVLDATDELLLVIAQGARLNDPPTVQWLVDAHHIAASGRVNWTDLAERAAAARLAAPVADTLAYLAAVGANIPEAAVASLAGIETSWREKAAARLSGSRPGPAGMLPRDVGDFLRATAHEPPLAAARAFPRHLQDAWGLERGSELPRAALRKVAARARSRRPPRTQPPEE
ncbi:MAG TPA: hypothetical protein VHK22_06495 [Gaiellaceae bacterium]|jgi:hypothetical protein|nr:hypothetical protein [Gaiellaceae bacterium]